MGVARVGTADQGSALYTLSWDLYSVTGVLSPLHSTTPRPAVCGYVNMHACCLFLCIHARGLQANGQSPWRVKVP